MQELSADALAANVERQPENRVNKLGEPENQPQSPPGALSAWTHDDAVGKAGVHTATATAAATEKADGIGNDGNEKDEESEGGQMVLTLEATGDLRKGDRMCWQCMHPIKKNSSSCQRCGANLSQKLCWSCGKPVNHEWYHHAPRLRLVLLGVTCSKRAK